MRAQTDRPRLLPANTKGNQTVSEIVTIGNKPGDEGAVYTLRFDDGQEREIGDAEADYHTLADIIDRAFEGKTR